MWGMVMKVKAIKIFEFLIYWSIILIPFATAISNGMLNSFMSMLVVSFIISKLLKKEPFFIKTRLGIVLALFFFVTCISIVHSVNIQDTLKGGILRLLQYIFVFFAVLQETKDKKHLGLIIGSVVFSLLLISIDAIWQDCTGKDFIRGYLPIVQFSVLRAKTSFSDPNTMGIYLATLFPLLLGCYFYFKKNKKIIFFCLTCIVLIGILLTTSRFTIIATYVVLLLFGIVRKSKITIIALVIFVLILPLILPTSVKNEAKKLAYNPMRCLLNDDRIAVFANSLNMIKDHPVIGLGANTYMKNYKRYKNSPQYRNTFTEDFMYAHNNFLHMAAEIGLLGLAIFIWFLYRLFKEAIILYQRQPEGFRKIVLLSSIGCLIAFLVNGLYESSLYSARVALLFWYTAGLSLVVRNE
jgi:putative inorganic carbon (hco3(-)) transporter